MPLPYGTCRWTDDGEHIVVAESDTPIPPDGEASRRIHRDAALIHDQAVVSWHQHTSEALHIANTHNHNRNRSGEHTP